MTRNRLHGLGRSTLVVGVLAAAGWWTVGGPASVPAAGEAAGQPQAQKQAAQQPVKQPPVKPSPSPSPPPTSAAASPIHHPIQTNSREAQAAFDQGLALVYGFEYERAIESFRRAATLDPASPMPHWGIALALGPNINDLFMTGRMAAANAAAQQAVQLAATSGSPRERAYVSAMAARYTSAPRARLSSLYGAYAAAMRDLAAADPTDVDAATLFAESLMLSGRGDLWRPDGTPGEGAVEAQQALERALARAPDHIGANHHYIHLVESSNAPERGLRSAERLAKTTVSGHLLHMPSHIYIRLGDFRRAVASNIAAVAFDRAAGEAGHGATHRQTDGAMSLAAHSREFLAGSACLTGQVSIARQALTNLFVLLRFGAWAEILETPRPVEPVAQLEWTVARAIALTMTGQLDAATQAADDFERLQRALPENAMWWSDPVSAFLPVARHEMAARLAWARGDRPTAISAWREAVAAQDRLTPGEVPPWPWYHSTRESLGAALFLNGEFEAAALTFRDDLKRVRGNPRSLFGLWQSLARMGEPQAATARDAFSRAWADAEVSLSMESL